MRNRERPDYGEHCVFSRSKGFILGSDTVNRGSRQLNREGIITSPKWRQDDLWEVSYSNYS